MLQFDVVVARLKSEYNVEAVYESVNVATARWVECADAKKSEEFKRRTKANWRLMAAITSLTSLPAWSICAPAQERYPDVQFHQTREH